MSGLLVRAVLAFIALPGTVAFLVPLLLAPRPVRFVNPPGFVPLVAGIFLLLWCVFDFYRLGRGTLAPWSPPRELVVTGLYRYSRNPMYVAVLLILCGWAAGFSSSGLAVYALAVAVAFHLRVLLHEEPWLAREHGEKWTQYRARVPRWFGVLPGLVILVVASLWSAHQLLEIGVAHKAKTLCSGVFVSGRDAAAVITELQADDLAVLRFVSPSADLNARQVTAGIFGLTRRAIRVMRRRSRRRRA